MNAPARVLLLAGVLLAAACTAARPPVFDAPRTVGPRTLLLAPEIRMGRAGTTAVQRLGDRLVLELRQALSGSGLEILSPADKSGPPMRAAVLSAWHTFRQQGFGRIKPGTDLGVADELAPARSDGARSLVLAVLTRIGQGNDDDVYVPRPPDELIPPRETQPDYVIPQAGPKGEDGVALDLLVVDSATGRALAHRRVSYPASTPDDVMNALPVLVREVSRGISR